MFVSKQTRMGYVLSRSSSGVIYEDMDWDWKLNLFAGKSSAVVTA
jgi:hypothetical protein